MTKKAFDAILASRMPSIIAQIKHAEDKSAEQAASEFFRSGVYADLIDPATGVADFSTPLLIDLYNEEKSTGSYDYPEVL